MGATTMARVLPLFGTDTDALVKRWADHPVMRMTQGVEDRREMARWLEADVRKAKILAEFEARMATDETELRKTWGGRIRDRAADLAARVVIRIEELFGL